MTVTVEGDADTLFYFRFRGIADMAEMLLGLSRSKMTRSGRVLRIGRLRTRNRVEAQEGLAAAARKPLGYADRAWRIQIMRFFSLVLCAGIYSVPVTTERVHSQSTEAHSAHVGPMGICNPVSERRTEVGCWIITNEKIGKLPATPLYWYIDRFATREVAAAAKGAGTVIEALGHVWLMTLAGNDAKASGGERAAKIGPLPIEPGVEYTAQYMESVFTPGMTAPPHRHPGPEAWYTLAGETCLETPEGKVVDRPGQEPHVIIPGGRPMHLRATGNETRRSIILVLHDSSKPAGVPAPDWKPANLCKN